MVSNSDADQQAAAAPPEQANDIDGLRAENAAVRDRLLRALAETENTRRQAERSAEDARQYGIASFARELLPVVDNLRRAVEAAERHRRDTPEDSALIDGVRATEQLLMNALARFGVRRIEAQGQPFDPALHEAMMEVDDPNAPPGSVVRVLEDGYTLHDRLLRPARVVVNRRSAEAQQEVPEVDAPGIAPNQQR
jgi:molecular chaperone GrpE